MPIWDRLITLQSDIQSIFDKNMERYEEEHLDRFNQSGWVNLTWRSSRFRRAHIDIVDARESHKLWMMHVCVFPSLKSGAPIYGFDVVSGQSKVTGVFHDFSPVNLNDPAIDHFAKVVSQYQWTKPRTVPDWGKSIFSDSMIAAGNIQTSDEIQKIIDLALTTTSWYVNDMVVQGDMPSSYAHNKYCHYQKKNPHLSRSVAALGLNDEERSYFINQCLFPEI